MPRKRVSHGVTKVSHESVPQERSRTVSPTRVEKQMFGRVCIPVRGFQLVSLNKLKCFEVNDMQHTAAEKLVPLKLAGAKALLKMSLLQVGLQPNSVLVPSSFLFLVVMPGATSSFLVLLY